MTGEIYLEIKEAVERGIITLEFARRIIASLEEGEVSEAYVRRFLKDE